MSDEPKKKRTIRVTRRRKGSKPEGEARADAPKRRESRPAAPSASSSGAPPATGPTTGAGLPGLGGPTSILGIGVLLVFACIFVVFKLLFSPDSGTDEVRPQTQVDEPAASDLLGLPTQAAVQPAAAATVRPLSLQHRHPATETRGW